MISDESYDGISMEYIYICILHNYVMYIHNQRYDTNGRDGSINGTMGKQWGGHHTIEIIYNGDIVSFNGL